MPTGVLHSLGYTWDFVVSLYWHRYPNPHSKHVLTEDVLERQILPGRKLYTKRLILKQALGSLPNWLRRIISGAKELTVEESILDMHSKKLEVVTRNVGAFTKYATISEYCSYTPHPDIFGSTSIFKTLHVEFGKNITLRYPINYFLSHRYPGKAKSATLGYEFICKLYDDKTQLTKSRSASTKVKDTLKNAAIMRTREAREFASNALPHVVRADVGRLNKD